MTMQNDPSDLDTATSALRSREPIFHRSEFGTSRSDFDAMMADDFREVGASGSKYSRETTYWTCWKNGTGAKSSRTSWWRISNAASLRRTCSSPRIFWISPEG